MMEELTGAEVNKIMRGEFVPRKVQRRPCGPSLEITIPVPPKSTHPNARSKDWRARAGGNKKQRDDAATAASAMLICERLAPPCWQYAEVQATFYLPRKHDSSNLNNWLKATWDGLQDAQIILNDSGLTALPPKQITAKEAKGERKVVLVITSRTLV